MLHCLPPYYMFTGFRAYHVTLFPISLNVVYPPHTSAPFFRPTYLRAFSTLLVCRSSFILSTCPAQRSLCVGDNHYNRDPIQPIKLVIVTLPPYSVINQYMVLRTVRSHTPSACWPAWVSVQIWHPYSTTRCSIAW